ncbi:hypothetical protein BJX68DRAFT_73797 [Aspergillus pseudodeflectus]|uniref:C2H2-type domain-containing protein n=1 Tax=Aspergillus pseudodeflectus TaxID=176178 RepID=A0ABR4KF12_9EURO
MPNLTHAYYTVAEGRHFLDYLHCEYYGVCQKVRCRPTHARFTSRHSHDVHVRPIQCASFGPSSYKLLL